MIEQLFTEKLRPKKFDQLILSTRIKKSLNNGVPSQNILLYSSPGTGKTSAAKVIASGYPTLYINCSDESGVDTIRDNITKFCSSISVMEGEVKTKIVILDEIDGVSDQFFKALRGTMEKFDNCRFIATCNYINKIPGSIQSRFECINFDLINSTEIEEVRSEWFIRLNIMFTKLDIQITPDALEEFVDRNFPDMRSVLNKLQSFKNQQIKSIDKASIKELNWSFTDLYNLINAGPDPYNNYKLIVGDYSTKVDDVMDALGKDFIEWIKTNEPKHVPSIPMIIIEVASSQAQRMQVIDPIVSLLSLIFKIQNILSKK